MKPYYHNNVFNLLCPNYELDLQA